MTDYSVFVPFLPRRPEQLLPYAALVRWTSAVRLWQGQSVLIEPHHGFGYVAGAGFRVPTGLGVSLMALRHPYDAALLARSLALTTGESVVAGFGPGAPSFQHGMTGSAYPSPLGASREYLTIVRSLLVGDAVDTVGRYFVCSAALPPVSGTDVRIGLGVLRPGMARLAGELADVAISWLTPAGYLAEAIVPALQEGAAAAGRPRPRLVAIVPLAIGAADRDPARLALASNGAHLKGPHYRDMLRRAGVAVTGDAESDGAALVGGRAFLSGDPDRLLELLDEYRAAGVDEVVLNVTGVCGLFGAKAALAELEALLGMIGSAS